MAKKLSGYDVNRVAVEAMVSVASVKKYFTAPTGLRPLLRVAIEGAISKLGLADDARKAS